MVRLKGNVLYVRTPEDFIFQFLMVRLKGWKLPTVSRPTLVISIPYGAIKRMSKNQKKHSPYDISIPYGAIKSLFALCPHQHIFCISIPYGAIKRDLVVVCKVLLLPISIPYGAIKSFCVVFEYKPVYDFNSLWCD